MGRNCESSSCDGGSKGACYLKLLSFALFVLILDQWTKNIVVTHLNLGEVIPVIEGYFNFTLVYNPGAAFGVFSELPEMPRRVVLGVVSFLALGVVFWYLRTEAKDDPVSQFALMGILGGAIGNIIDRFRYDAVVDFLDFYINNYHWPAFNIADSAISLGVATLILRMMISSMRKEGKGDLPQN